jgi:CheY-like chemotaxis protein
MDSKMIEAVASLAWPILAFAFAVVAYGPLSRIVGNIASRGGTIKIGQVELSSQEVNDQQQGILVDIQNRLIKLEEITQNSTTQGSDDFSLEGNESAKKILWVDNKPENNAIVKSLIEQHGHSIILEKWISEANLRVKIEKFDLIVTGIIFGLSASRGRDFVFELRKKKEINTPVVIFDANISIDEYDKKWAAEYNVSLITNSPIELLKFISELDGKAKNA